jgi:DNA-directed RNA polymerase specialized sigma24 family protein
MSLPESTEVPSIGMSFDRFYSLELRRLVGLAYVLTGNRSIAEDLANEALLVAQMGNRFGV